MYAEMMSYYGLIKDLDKADYFETEAFTEAFAGLKAALSLGGVIAITGIAGCGKTVAWRRMKRMLKEDGKFLFCESLAIDKRRVDVNTLYTALFCDLPAEKDFKIPARPEKRERIFRELVRKVKSPIVLSIDEAHDLPARTLIGFKDLIETVEEAEGTLAIVAVGRLELADKLRKPNMKKVRTRILNLDPIGADKLQYIEWILEKCSRPGVKPQNIVSREAMELLAERLITPLQITHYLRQALEKGYEAGSKPIDAEVIETVLAPDLNSVGSELVGVSEYRLT